MINIIIKDIVDVFDKYIFYAVISGVFLTLSIFIITFFLSREKLFRKIYKNRKQIILLNLLFIYCFVILSVTLFNRPPGSRGDINLRLFSTITLNTRTIIYPIENVILFVPLGFLLPLILDRFNKTIWVLGSGMLFSIAIEVAQHVTRRGYLQIDDVMLNLIGTLIGYITIMDLQRLLKKIPKSKSSNA